MSTFAPTHLIRFAAADGKIYETFVQLCEDGTAYTREEWEAASPADWERHEDGSWTCLGQATPGGASGTVEVLEVKHEAGSPTAARIEVELDSAVGPRVVLYGEVERTETEAALPAGWSLSETPAVQTDTGGWSYPLVQAQETPCKPSFFASRAEAVSRLQVELDRVFGLRERVKVVARVPPSHLWVELDRGVCSEPMRAHTDTTQRVLRLFRDGAGADEGRQIVLDAIRPPREVAELLAQANPGDCSLVELLSSDSRRLS